MVLIVTFWDVNVSLVLTLKTLIVPFWKIKHLFRQVLFIVLRKKEKKEELILPSCSLSY